MEIKTQKCVECNRENATYGIRCKQCYIFLLNKNNRRKNYHSEHRKALVHN